MVKLLIEGGNRLSGAVRVDSSKNALLPIIAACVLVDGQVTLLDVPKISDTDNMLHILAGVGCRVRREGADVHIDASGLSCSEINSASAMSSSAQKIRGSLIVLGALLGRFKSARIPYPGGCAIGNRPIDLHIQGLRDLGVVVSERNGFISCNGKRFAGGTVYLDFPSVGATENLVLAATLGKTSTTIINAAKEPEVTDLCNFLNACGACIRGAGTSTISINGVAKLRGVTYTAIPDRIITGSYLIAVAAVGGNVTLTNTRPQHNESLVTKLRKSGCTVNCYDDKIQIEAAGATSPRAARARSLGSIQTSPYPGFPTDLQSQMTVYQALCRGTSTVTENLFESRFKYIPELVKLGAKITVRDRTAIVTGVDGLAAATGVASAALALTASDLRGGVALVIAALAAEGRTVINNADFIYRGHQAIESDLAALGANVIKIEE